MFARDDVVFFTCWFLVLLAIALAPRRPPVIPEYPEVLNERCECGRR